MQHPTPVLRCTMHQPCCTATLISAVVSTPLACNKCFTKPSHKSLAIAVQYRSVSLPWQVHGAPAQMETQMVTKPKANSVITHQLNGSLLTFMVKDSGNVVLDMSKLHSDVLNRAAVHGMIQRISDAAALSRDADTGKPALPGEKLAAMRELVDHYMSGTAEWSRRRAGSGVRRLSDAKLLAVVLERLGRKLKVEIDSLSAAQVTALLMRGDFKQTADAVRAEMARDVDTEELLSDLE